MDIILLMKKWVLKLDLSNQGHMTHNGILITICQAGQSQKDIPSNLKLGKREIRRPFGS